MVTLGIFLRVVIKKLKLYNALREDRWFVSGTYAGVETSEKGFRRKRDTNR